MFLKGLDLFGKPFSLLINKREQFQTWQGGVASLITILSGVALVILFLVEYTTNRTGTIKPNEIILSDGKQYNLKQYEHFAMSIGFMDMNTNMIDIDLELVDFSYGLMTASLKPDNTVNLTIQNRLQSAVKCTPEYLTEKLRNNSWWPLMKNASYCIDFPREYEIPIGEDIQGTGKIFYPFIQIKPYADRLNDTEYLDLYREETSRIKFLALLSDYWAPLLNDIDYIKQNPSRFYKYDVTASKNFQINLKQVITQTYDHPLPLFDSRSESYITVDSITVDSFNTQNFEVTFNFVDTKSELIIERYYDTIDIYIAKWFAFFNVIYIILHILTLVLTSHSDYHYLVEEFFRFLPHSEIQEAKLCKVENLEKTNRIRKTKVQYLNVQKTPSDTAPARLTGKINPDDDELNTEAYFRFSKILNDSKIKLCCNSRFSKKKALLIAKLRNALSVESLLKGLFDLEKLKTFLLRRNKTLFENYYLNGYSVNGTSRFESQHAQIFHPTEEERRLLELLDQEIESYSYEFEVKQ